MRVYGPVPSRRFGLSLGVDILPHKTCPLDCIYCQLGPTDCLSTERRDFYPIADIIADVKEALADGPAPDVITLAGSGEPGLYRSLGELIDELKKLSAAPVLLITNGILLTDPDCAAASLKADILAPSLDAGDEETFIRVNRPAEGIRFDAVVDALRRVTHAHPGTVRLEIMLIRDVNDSEESLRKINEIVHTLRCDQIDLNTPVRPPVPERGALPSTEETLALARQIFGPRAVPIATFARKPATLDSATRLRDADRSVRETLGRRPSTVADLCASHGLSRQEATDILERLMKEGLAFADPQGDQVFYRAPLPR